MFRYPEIYQTGIAVASVTNQLYYDNIYQERYMGVPWETMEDYIEGSPVTHAKNLEGNLLIIDHIGKRLARFDNHGASAAPGRRIFGMRNRERGIGNLAFISVLVLFVIATAMAIMQSNDADVQRNKALQAAQDVQKADKEAEDWKRGVKFCDSLKTGPFSAMDSERKNISL